MIARGTQLLTRAHAEGWAVPAFSVYNLEQALGVCRAAERTGRPALLQAGSSAFRYAGLAPLAGVSLAAAEDADATVGVHLDHATDEVEIRRCLDLGYTSVMYDGSALPLDENIARTRAVVREAVACGAWVEGELAGIAGDEDQSGEVGAGSLTDPRAAERFVAETGVHALAVGVGNVHGISARPTPLDLDRLAAIRERVDVPLVLHGGSGLPEPEVRAAVALGVAKLNVNTELRRAFLDAVRTGLGGGDNSDALASLLKPAIGAVCDVAMEKLRSFGSAPQRAERTR